MIRNDEELDAALEESIALLDGPLDPAVEERLEFLIQAIEEYRTRTGRDEAPAGVLTEERERLRRHLASFQERWPERTSVMTDVDAVIARLFGRDARAGGQL